MPSPVSRKNNFYYSHPQNRFWKLLADLFNEPIPQFCDERREFLFKHNIALWDVLKSCYIKGADDSSIKQPIVNDISGLLNRTNITKVFTTGKTAYKLYQKLCSKETGINAIPLPSTSPANQRYYKYNDLIKEYSVILKYI